MIISSILTTIYKASNRTCVINNAWASFLNVSVCTRALSRACRCLRTAVCAALIWPRVARRYVSSLVLTLDTLICSSYICLLLLITHSKLQELFYIFWRYFWRCTILNLKYFTFILKLCIWRLLHPAVMDPGISMAPMAMMTVVTTSTCCI